MQDDGIALYRRFLSGDERALEELIALYQRGLLRFLYGYTRDLAIAEDLLTDTFFSLYCKRAYKERNGVTFKTYLYTVARNKALNHLKKQARRREISLDGLAELNNGDMPDEETGNYLYGETLEPDRALERKERDLALRLALQKLKPEYREVLVLRYFEDMSPETIAKITKRNSKQVYNLLARGKTALKEELLSKGGQYEDF